MKCGYINCQVEIPDGLKVKGRFKRFCCPQHRAAQYKLDHIIVRKHPKRIRTRERERLYTIIHRGETLEQLREQAREAARVQALRNEEK